MAVSVGSAPLKSLPPLVPGQPILGNALALLKDPLPFMVENYQKIGSIFRFRALNREFIVMAGPTANQFLMKSGELLTVKETYSGVSEGMKSNHFLLNHDGEMHRKLRKALQRGYSKQAFSGQMTKAVELTRKMTGDWKTGERIKVVPALKRLITDQLGILLMNHAPDEYFPDIQTFFTTNTQVSVTGMWPGFMLSLPPYRKAQTRLFELAAKVIEEHRNREFTPETRDIVDDALAARDDNGDPYPEDFLRAAVIGTYIAGIDTVALTCSFALYALLKHPGVWDRVRTEALPVFNGRMPMMDELRKLEVLHAALLEILRYYPVAPGAPRTAAADFEFEGYRVPKGANVLIGTSVTHFLPEFFPNPYQFDIDRYIEPRHENRQTGAFAPFTLGEHTCLGAGMAEVQVMTILGALVSSTSLELDPPNYELRVSSAPSRGPNPEFAVRVR